MGWWVDLKSVWYNKSCKKVNLGKLVVLEYSSETRVNRFIKGKYCKYRVGIPLTSILKYCSFRRPQVGGLISQLCIFINNSTLLTSNLQNLNSRLPTTVLAQFEMYLIKMQSKKMPWLCRVCCINLPLRRGGMEDKCFSYKLNYLKSKTIKIS